MNKKVKFARAQRPKGASTSAEHPGTDRQQGTKRKGASTKTIIGASLIAAGAGALYVLGRRNWPAIKQQASKLKDQAGKLGEQAGQVAADLKGQASKVAADLKEQAGSVTADLKDKVGGGAPADPKDKAGKAAGVAKSSKPAGEAPVDVALNKEVAESTKSSPKAASGFTDEGATGNND
ncbi:hypothetical protein LJ737_26425 [Hymenobacter sp. 15J16-1T3B]|uniref:hypothetical protein n=1 Tax=Hymenobacter sp. 15J16-1T3B TaxID=2886941 RepID=UPI001D12658C|nr:hypothetical protein [Hymenobacter sp. 15J16-1T3B]MCC3160801.1 hypothetical protein [Hymenobacter sp. 15J16-1T3B]